MFTIEKGRILDIPCKVCGDFSSGKHYNIFACDGCAGFFKRSIRRNRSYTCKAKEVGNCIIDKVHRNQCRACRLVKCQEAGMNKDAVQHERGPRNSTLKKQQMNYMNEANSRLIMTPPQPSVLNLTIRKPTEPPSPRMEPVFPFIPHPAFFYNNAVTFPWIPCPSGVPAASPTALSNVPSVSPTALSSVPDASPTSIPSVPMLTVSDASAISAICESAAKLLIMNVQWARSIASFISLPLSDQLLLLEDCWRELFILGSAQFLPLNEMTGAFFHREDPAITTFAREVREFQEILMKLHQFQLDQHEFACLRAIVLFRTSLELPDSSVKPELRELAKIKLIQDDSLSTLDTYITTTHHNQPKTRFIELMRILPTMRGVSSYTIEELFFRKTIGNIPIVRIICDMYRAEGMPLNGLASLRRK